TDSEFAGDHRQLPDPPEPEIVQLELGDDADRGRVVGAVELDGSTDGRVALEGGMGVGEAKLAVRAREDAEPKIGQGLVVDSEILHEVELGAGERPAFDLRPGADLRYPVPPVELDPLSRRHSGPGDEERQAHQ